MTPAVLQLLRDHRRRQVDALTSLGADAEEVHATLIEHDAQVERFREEFDSWSSAESSRSRHTRSGERTAPSHMPNVTTKTYADFTPAEVADALRLHPDGSLMCQLIEIVAVFSRFTTHLIGRECQLRTEDAVEFRRLADWSEAVFSLVVADRAADSEASSR